MADWGGMVQMAWISLAVVVAIGFAIGTVVGWLIRDYTDKRLGADE